MSAREFKVPNLNDVKMIVHSKFGITPCATWQLQSALHQLEKKNVFTISPTGSGKTFMFWIPLLFNNNGIILIVTPLNILGEKTHNEAKTLGFPAYNLSTENATDEAFNESDLYPRICYSAASRSRHGRVNFTWPYSNY
ncbi:uncharacterized protein EDB93DRAFT_1273410 [Suillus bovinus]|uniref:uncharacterized protein n=1 Tax=Suillus bovinus TaxID=48563 RepID=UPI001B85CAED|nr:uncharacterized protein EDB93DRAFT_1273410 [Suillus bovinus]KAG2152654.1 hypothetical protein EDB93DRAFT_1273410 [Suillus bovinus]